MKQPVINKLLTPYNFTDKNSDARIKYIVIHYVGALGGAKANCQYYAGRYIGASAHFFVGFEGEIWQAVETEDIAWHCGASSYKHAECRNSNSIGIELCVRKRNTASMGATDKDWYFEDATVEAAVALTRYLMEKYKVPASHVIRHYDVTGKICPNPYVYNTTAHTWEKFKQLISGAASAGGSQTERLYRVRKSWEDAKSQIGAYSSLDNAKKACTDGYTVYDWNGKAVYNKKNKGTQAATFSAMTEEQAVKKIGELCKEDAAKSGILASVSAAQMILESGYVKTELAQQANNAFGMKCELSGNAWDGSAWDGNSKYKKQTKEQKESGEEYTITADFRKYPCLEDSIADHSAYLLGAKKGNNLRYAGIKGETDYEKAITIIKNGDYATDTNYIKKVCSIIEKWKLHELDDTQQAAVPQEKPQAAAGVPFKVKVDILDLRIRTGAGTDYAKTGEYTGKGVFTITEVKAGKGSTAGWGKLKSGAGWISLDYATRLA